MIKVSIIEDQPQILRSLRDKIQSYSKEICIVSEFLNGRDAILSIKTNPPDIVFTDIRMPQLDGLKMISILKKEHPNILFVIISGFGEFEYTHEAIKLGVTEYLLKPVKNDDLYAILRKLIKQVEISKYLRERAALYSAINNQQKQLENYHSFLKCAKYDAFLINFGHYIMSISDVSDSINALLFDSDLKAALKKIIPNYSKIWTFKGKHLNELYLIIGNKNDKNIIDPHSLLHLLKDLFEPVTYSCKLNISEPKFFYTAFNNMRLLVRKNLVFCRSSFLNQDKEHTIQANTIDASFETRIIRSLETLDKNSFF